MKLVAMAVVLSVVGGVRADGTADVVPLVPAPQKVVMRGGFGENADVRVVRDSSVPAEGYRLTVGETGVDVRCSDAAGEQYARQTLRQMRQERDGETVYPLCEIEDAPAFRWRGVHLDVSRHFWTVEQVKRILGLMAEHKFNVFHWHLTDSQGWRLPVDRYPEMTEAAAKRPYSKCFRDLVDEVPEGTAGEYGPFSYTKDEVRDIIAFAQGLSIRVVPEVEIPGHARSTFYAHPELLCFADDPAAKPTNAVANVYCVGNPKTYEFLENVLDEVCALFPDPVVHIGGDEVKKVNWQACPRCRAKMKELGVTTPEELQAKVNGHFADYLAKKGKRAIWWGEIPEREVPKNLAVMSWLGAECGVAAAKKGIEAVMCEHFYTYFDYSPCVADDPCTYPWFTEKLPVSKVYSYDPLKGIPPEFQKYILGGECCNWTEYTCTEQDLDWKLWTRAAALSEVLWTGAGRPGYADFYRRLTKHRARLVAEGVNCSPPDLPPVDDPTLLEELIRIPSVSADIPQVNRAVRHLRDRLASDGLSCRVETMDDGREVLFAANVDTQVPDVLLSAHLDVVPAQTPDQFVPRREDGRIFGRGASDCKEHCVLAARLMRELKDKVSVGCVFGSDEEMGGRSTAFMMEKGYDAKKLVIVLDSEQYAITTRQKGLAHYVFDRDLLPVHTGMVKGPVPNAAVELMRGYEELTKVLADYEDGSWRDMVSLVSVSGGRDHAELKVCLRTAEYGSWERLEGLLREKLGGKMTCLRKGDPVILDETAPHLVEFRERMRAKWPERNVDFYHLNSSTDARHLQYLKKPMLILGVDARGAHAPGEYVVLSSLDEHAELIGSYLRERFGK